MKEDLSLLGGVSSYFCRMLLEASECVLSAFSFGKVFILPHLLNAEIAFFLTFSVIKDGMLRNECDYGRFVRFSSRNV